MGQNSPLKPLHNIFYLQLRTSSWCVGLLVVKREDVDLITRTSKHGNWYPASRGYRNKRFMCNHMDVTGIHEKQIHLAPYFFSLSICHSTTRLQRLVSVFFQLQNPYETRRPCSKAAVLSKELLKIKRRLRKVVGISWFCGSRRASLYSSLNHPTYHDCSQGLRIVYITKEFEAFLFQFFAPWYYWCSFSFSLICPFCKFLHWKCFCQYDVVSILNFFLRLSVVRLAVYMLLSQ